MREFGPLTVPLVSASSLLALSSLVFASEAVRGADVARRSTRVTTVVSVPGALILGISLLRSAR